MKFGYIENAVLGFSGMEVKLTFGKVGWGVPLGTA